MTAFKQKLRQFTFPPTDAIMLPTETLKDLYFELLLVSRMYASVPYNAIHELVIYGMDKQKYIDSIFNKMYNQYSYATDALLDKILNTYKE
jgi:hypothetical protein